MLEAGIGRAMNIACASLPGFNLPGDLAAPLTYLQRDIVDHRFELLPDGTVAVPNGPGIGVEVDEDYLSHVTSRMEVFG
jgi:O-succinylbenzoate synthase